MAEKTASAIRRWPDGREMLCALCREPLREGDQVSEVELQLCTGSPADARYLHQACQEAYLNRGWAGRRGSEARRADLRPYDDW